jgi:hypothetical protein
MEPPGATAIWGSSKARTSASFLMFSRSVEPGRDCSPYSPIADPPKMFWEPSLIVGLLFSAFRNETNKLPERQINGSSYMLTAY